jgi:hypothetical protein
MIQIIRSNLVEDTLVYGSGCEVSEDFGREEGLGQIREVEELEECAGRGWTPKERSHARRRRLVSLQDASNQEESTQEESTESPEQKFKRLAAAWKAQRGPISSPTKLVMHPAYQSIVGMGSVAVPLLLRTLEQEADLWFWALRAITEADPVPPSSRGRIKEMAEAWLKWGREHGHR